MLCLNFILLFFNKNKYIYNFFFEFSLKIVLILIEKIYIMHYRIIKEYIKII